MRIEVSPPLGTAHRQCSECIFERLFEGEEFQNRGCNTCVETYAALVRTDDIVVLHTITHISLHLALVVNPSYTE